jgi:O-antigen/teichoic acid export membrane protein
LSRLRSHVRVPLYRSAYELTASAVGAAALGTVFWAIASRSFSTEDVGVSTAAISSLTFLTGVGSLYLDGALYRFLPRAGDLTGRLITWASLVCVAGAIVSSAIFLLGLQLWSPELSFATSSPWWVAACIAATSASCLLVVQDGALIGLRRTAWVPVKNIFYSAAKIVALVPLVALKRYGILAAWTAPSVVIVPATYVLLRRFGRRHQTLSRDRQESLGVRRVARYATGNYAGYLCTLAYRTLPPVLVLHEAGARASAFFYPPWLIATSLALLTTNLSISLVVEGSLDRDQLALRTRQAVVHAARLLIPTAAVLYLAAPYVLRIFGSRYAPEGTTLLRLLTVSLIPSSVCVMCFGVARIRDHVRSIIVNQVLLLVLVMGSSALLVPVWGISGVGVGWLVAQSVVAAILVWTELLPALGLTPRAGGGTRPAEIEDRA